MVYLAARNEERAKAAIESLHNAGLGQGGEHSLREVVWLKLDLGDPREAMLIHFPCRRVQHAHRQVGQSCSVILVHDFFPCSSKPPRNLGGTSESPM